VAGLLRRLGLAFQQRPAGPAGPAALPFAREALSLPGLVPGLRPTPAAPRAAHPRPVIVVPGFLAHVAVMRPLMRALAAAGHTVEDWGLGTNLGPNRDNLAALAGRARALHERTGMKITLVGWSLGGLFAREAAKLAGDAVDLVVTLGTPFSGSLRANNAWRLYQFVAGHDVDHPPIDGDLAAKPPVRTVALWSAADGIVAVDSARGKPGERDEAVELHCTHMAMAGHHEAVGEVLRQLDRD